MSALLGVFTVDKKTRNVLALAAILVLLAIVVWMNMGGGGEPEIRPPSGAPIDAPFTGGGGIGSSTNK